MKKGSYVILGNETKGVILKKKSNMFEVLIIDGEYKNKIINKREQDLKEISAPKIKYNFEVGDEIQYNNKDYVIVQLKGNLAQIGNKERTKVIVYDLPLSEFKLLQKNQLDIKEGDFVKYNSDICRVDKISKSGKANLYLNQDLEGRYYKNIPILGLEKLTNIETNDKPKSLSDWEVGKNSIFSALSEETVARETFIKYKGKNVLILTNRGHGDPDNISLYNYKDKTDYLKMFADDLRNLLTKEQLENMEDYSKTDDSLISNFIEWNDNGIVQNISLEDYLDGSYYKARFETNNPGYSFK